MVVYDEHINNLSVNSNILINDGFDMTGLSVYFLGRLAVDSFVGMSHCLLTF